MKTDLYTKTILTIIALCLSIIVIRGGINPVSAGKQNQDGMAMVPLNKDGSLNVKVINSTNVLDVNLKQINGYSIYSTIPVNIKEIAGSSCDNVIPVNLKELNGSGLYNAMPVKNTN